MGRVKSWMEDLKESAMVDCADCHGDGTVETIIPMQQNFNRDVGFLDHRIDECQTCRGTGQVEGEDESW